MSKLRNVTLKVTMQAVNSSVSEIQYQRQRYGREGSPLQISECIDCDQGNSVSQGKLALVNQDNKKCTVNMYQTTCSMLINGPALPDFVILPLMQGVIEYGSCTQRIE